MATLQRKRDRRQLITGGIIVWAALVSLFFLWEIITYSGAMALLAEWQFNVFGSFYPSVTYLAIVVLLAAPCLLFFLRVRKRDSEQRLGLAMLRSATIFRRLMLGIGTACLLAALATLLIVLTLPSSSGTPRALDLSQPVVSLPTEGPTTIVGAILYDRTAAFNEDVLITRRSTRFAPIIPPGSTNTALQFFVELPPETTAQTGSASMTGILKRNALPGEIIRLYRYAGFTVEPPYYVLFASNTQLRWPYFDLSAELAIAAILFLGLGVWQHRRIKWLEKTIASSRLPLTSS